MDSSEQCDNGPAITAGPLSHSPCWRSCLDHLDPARLGGDANRIDSGAGFQLGHDS
jgi:hypothetical protein